MAAKRDPEMMLADEMDPKRKKPLGVASGEKTAAGTTTDLGYGQQARDTRMLKTERNIATAQLMGRSNPNSAFNPNNRNYSPDRADLIRDRAMLNEQVATREMAAGPGPRYETDPTGPRATAARENLATGLEKILMNEAGLKQLPGNQPGPVDPSAVAPRVDAFRQSIAPKPPDAESMLAQERGQNRYAETKALATADANQRTQGRERASEIGGMEYERVLAQSDAERRMAQAGASRAEAEATRAGMDSQLANMETEIAMATLPNARAREVALRTRAESPIYSNAVKRIGEGIRAMSGKQIDSSDRQMQLAMNDGLQTLRALPEEAQSLAAAEILANLQPEKLDLPREAFENSWLQWLMNKVGSAVIPGEVPSTTSTKKWQDAINRNLEMLRRKAAQSGVNPAIFQASAATPE